MPTNIVNPIVLDWSELGFTMAPKIDPAIAAKMTLK